MAGALATPAGFDVCGDAFASLLEVFPAVGQYSLKTRGALEAMGSDTNPDIQEATDALLAIQKFDPSSLAREAELGAAMNFKGFVPYAERIVNLFQKIPASTLPELPRTLVDVIRISAKRVIELFERVLNFAPLQSNASGVRDSLHDDLVHTYDNLFSGLFPAIAYGALIALNIPGLQADLRAAIDGAQRDAALAAKSIDEQRIAAGEALRAIREAARDAGVTATATHFEAEHKLHSEAAESWNCRTWLTAAALIGSAFLSLWAHKLDGLDYSNPYAAGQIALSKLLIFAVISFLLLFSTRNYMNHRHNAVVNRHRQNALMTYKALMEATTDQGAKDAIMAHAASCIFAPQPTGYTSKGGDSETSGPRSIVELISKHDEGGKTR